MKKFGLKLICLTLVLSFLLCGCGEAKPAGDGTTATEPAITTEEALKTALEAEGRVVIGADIQLTSEVIVKDQILDGGGYTLTGPEYIKDNVVTENGITISGGTVENVTVKGAYRGIGNNKENRVNGDIRLNNVTVDSDNYVLNFGYGDNSSSLYVTGSILQGWTSYTGFREVQFTDCTFGWCESGKNGNLRPYNNTTLINCKFIGRTEADGTVTPFNLSFKSGSDGVTLILEDCYVGDTLITPENINELLAVDAYGNTVEVRNTAS